MGLEQFYENIEDFDDEELKDVIKRIKKEIKERQFRENEKYNCIRHKFIGKGFCPDCEDLAKSEADYQNTCPFREGE